MHKASTGATAEVINKIAELGRLKENGLITEAEFMKMKEKLLADI